MAGSIVLPSRLSLGLPRLYRKEGMATLGGNLWDYNLIKVIIIDVSDDYRLMQPPLPSDFYPVLCEKWLPRHKLADNLPEQDLIDGYLYDWHELQRDNDRLLYVGVVDQQLASELMHS